MMKKRIIAVTLVMALTLAMLPTAHAFDPLGYVRTTFWDYVHDFSHEIGNDAATVWNNTIGAFWDGFNGTPEQAYDNYVQHVANTIGAPIVSKNGYIIPINPSTGELANYAGVEYYAHNYTPVMYPAWSTVTVANNGIIPKVSGMYGGNSEHVMVYDGTVQVINEVFGLDIDGNDASVSAGLSFILVNGNAAHAATPINALAGTVLTLSSDTLMGLYGGGSVSHPRHNVGPYIYVYFRTHLKITPFSFNPNTFTAPIGGSGSRLTNTGINVMGSDNTVYENVSFVDETNNTFYNPTTNTTTAFENWQYDYSTREYTLTTSDNKQITIRYGDDSVVYKEGDTIVYNYYYALPDTPAPTPTPAEPTPTPPAPTAHTHSW
jgi:hypothetical protein